MSKPAYFMGLDLGQQQDYTALSILRKVRRPELVPSPILDGRSVIGYAAPRETSAFERYELQYLHRFETRTPYAEIARRVREIQVSPAFEGAGLYVVADATGLGRPILEMLSAEGVTDLYGVTITGGTSASGYGWDVHVPKRDLASTLGVLLENGRLVWHEEIPFRRVLEAELQNFRVKINIATGHDSYEAWREGDHDDVVLSIAMACWFAENREPDDWTGASRVGGYNRMRSALSRQEARL